MANTDNGAAAGTAVFAVEQAWASTASTSLSSSGTALLPNISLGSLRLLRFDIFLTAMK